MEIRTERLLLRPLRKGDVDSIVENANNLDIASWLLSLPFLYTKESAVKWINRNKSNWRIRDKDDYCFGIELLEIGKIIGSIGIHHIDKYQKTATIGYWLGEKYWNNGYGSEALKVVIGFGFEKLKLNRLEACVFVGNPSSGKLLEKYGFKQEGLKRQSARCKADGKIKDEYIYGLLKEDWERYN